MFARELDPLITDAADIAYAFSSESFGILDRPKSALPRRGKAVRMAAYCYHWAKVAWAQRRYQRADPVPGCIAFFANTVNQFSAVAPVAAQLPNAQVFGEFGIGRYAFPSAQAYRQSVRWIVPVLAAARSAPPYVQSAVPYFLDQFALAHGYAAAAIRWLSEIRPSTVVVSNDHNLQHRAIVWAARQLGVPTVYMQHASVTDRFPPLATDFALLDGDDSLEKYIKIGSTQTTIYLTGSPKSAVLLKMRTTANSRSGIGVCTNRLDEPAVVEKLCRGLRERLPDRVIELRLHPADLRRGVWSRTAERANVLLGPSDESAAEFLGRRGIIIAGASGILLEAALAGSMAISFTFNPEFADPYGFVSSGLVRRTSDPEELVWFILQSGQQMPFDISLLRRYDATVATPFEGQATELAAKTIVDLAGSVGVDGGAWERIREAPVVAYRPLVVSERSREA